MGVGGPEEGRTLSLMLGAEEKTGRGCRVQQLLQMSASIAQRQIPQIVPVERHQVEGEQDKTIRSRRDRAAQRLETR